MNAPGQAGASGPCDIAIVGLAGRFPGAPNPPAFWNNLCEGIESISRFEEAELEDAFCAAQRAQPNFVRARSVLAGVDEFDAGFFGMQAREAELTDPQHRVFLECCWEALEDAGYDPATYAGAIGVLAGCSINTYFLRHVLQDRARADAFASDYQVGSYAELLGAGHDFLATRVAYKLDLRGPAMTLQSACSTALNTVAQACQQLMLGQADMMLAGAVSITFPQQRGYLHTAGGMVSADGHCRPFDARADGTVFGAGAGVVLLKRTADALADGDAIWARIRGFGVNNDGSSKVGYTAPSIAGQAKVIAAAQAMAGIAPAQVGFVECHGTATPLGDPIEFAALAEVFGRSAPGAKTCVLGSVKSNVGHLDVAAGMTSLIKAALAVRHRRIPPTLHFTEPNPRIDLAGSPFTINTTLIDWPAGDARYAGVSAFGVGGTNVHLVLESAPPAHQPANDRTAQLISVSARTPAALRAACERLQSAFATLPEADFAAAAWTLATGRRQFAFRSAVVASQPAEAVQKLGACPPPRTAANQDRSVAFLFPGQGAQYPGMGRELYAQVPAFRAALDRCAAILTPLIGSDLRALLYDGPAGDGRALASTEFTQPAIFAVEYALAQTWIDCGIRPAALIGHSVGEFVAACLAGVMTLEDALSCVAVRGKLMGALPGGAMLAVRLTAAQLEPVLNPAVEIAAYNAPEMCVAAGTFEGVAELEQRLTERGALFRRLETSHAFHSALVDPIVAPFAGHLSHTPLSSPVIPYVSTATGEWVTAAEATSPVYWAQHCRRPVRFAAALQTLVDADVDVLLEVGPGNALCAFARQGAGKDRCTIAASLPGLTRDGGELETLLATVGQLWVAGCSPDLGRLVRPHSRRRISLPSYPFERKRHWIDRPAAALATPPPDAGPPAVSPPLEMTAMAAASPLPPTGSTANAARRQTLEREIASVLEELSGEELGPADAPTSFLALGFDSLSLGRFATLVQSRFGVSVTFRQLLGDLPSIQALAEHISAVRPPQPGADLALVAAPALGVSAPPVAAAASDAPLGLEALMREQLTVMQQLMRDQLAALGAANTRGAANAANSPATPAGAPAAVPAAGSQPSALDAAAPSRFDVYRPAGGAAAGGLTDRQRAHIADLVGRTTARTPGSKADTQRARAVLADPRVAAGFRPEWKEMVYPIVCVRAKGSRLWDIDGNEYIDVLNGFGQTAFGHAPDFVLEAVTAQLERGFAIGPQTELAGEVATLFCELTGNERVTFCNTGSEAVMAALRLARTVTGRERVVTFNGAYHGQFDEVLIKGARNSFRALPVAPGIPAESVANMTVLPYGTPESLAWIRAHARELAAVVTEPVQSRHPALQPRAFLQELRDITQASGTALVFDEVVTGFRVHPGGMQAVFDIRADLATYGKVVGGGMPIGILAGKPRFMDALDGGMWRYGDDSIPEVAPTFFAGTFVRHPLVMAAVLAVLRHLKAAGPALQAALTERTGELVRRLNAELEERGLHSRIESFASLFYLNFVGEEPLAGLLYYHLRNRGVYIQEGFPCFLTTEHTAADVEQIVRAFRESFDELGSAGIFVGTQPRTVASVTEFALTEQQTEIWLSAQLGDAASCAFNESVCLQMHGTLDRSAFDAALTAVIARHDALRARLHRTGETMQIAPECTPAIAYSDLSHLAPSAAQSALEAANRTDARTPFDMFEGPLVRAQLFALSATEHVFVLCAHHIVCDGWSMNVILAELVQLYAAATGGERARLAAALPFSVYALAQAQSEPAERARIERYWLAQYAQPVVTLDLPTDRPRPAQKSSNGSTRTQTIDAGTARAIKHAGARNGCTLFVTLLTAFNALIGRLADASDIVVGVPAAGQALLEGEILVGHCVDFLPIRTRWTADARLNDLLAGVKQGVLDAYEHQNYTLGTLVRTLDLERGTNRVPLTEIQFNLERLADGLAAPNLTIDVTPNAKAFVNFDLFLNVIESDAGLRLDCDYNTDIFDAATIDRWLGHYRTLLEALVADSTTPVARVALLSAAERQAIVTDLNATAGPGFAAPTINALFEQRVARSPDAIAVRAGTASLTYGELERRSNALAHYLRGRIGSDGRTVGICMGRSVNILVALLATLKAGYAYVPLDPAHPAARLRYIVTNVEVDALIADDPSGVELAPPGVPVVHLLLDAAAIDLAAGAAPALPQHAGDLAYIIYTSGSTGVPKGVEVTHGSVVNLLAAMAHEPGLHATDVLLAVTTIAFDIAALELFLPLAVGATVCIAPSQAVADGDALRALIDNSGATVMQATPSTWRLLLEAGFTGRAGFTMLAGGEPLPRPLADRLLAGGATLWNMYGPTETTIWSSCRRILDDGAPITVGRPLLNTQFYVLDASDEPVPVGKTGQLHIGGAGVARGYVKRPELSAQKFAANPYHSGRMYRTGDAARLLASGEFTILGRLDDQVKLRGFRIELGEIEAVLMQSTNLAEVAVSVRADAADEARLVAYYVERPEWPETPASLRSAAGAHVPDYMVPAVWVKLDGLPRTANGKLDRTALPKPLEVAAPDDAFVEPQTPTERTLAEIWMETLALQRVSITDDILALGADSIHLFRITARANKRGLPVAAKALMRHRTIAQLARHLDETPAPPATVRGA